MRLSLVNLSYWMLAASTILSVKGQLKQIIQKTEQKTPKTYCNPLNLDYGYSPIPNLSTWGRHRTTADPALVRFKGDYYLFSTNQEGYWWSHDLSNWTFVSKRFLRPWNSGYDELCAPAVGVLGDTLVVFGSTYTKNFTLWMSTDPKHNDWKPLVDSLEIGGWDPAFFTDRDGRFYMYNGSSNRYPIYGIELNRTTMHPLGTRQEMYILEPERYGWQRFGEHLDNTFLDPFIEGAWMTRYRDKYYLQYGAPGTEFSGYSDGVLVGDHPLGPFVPQSDPLSSKPGGFIRGAGHGSTFQDQWQNYWHISTMVVSQKNNFERRLGFWPAGFDHEGVMWVNTSFGDYPHFIPTQSIDSCVDLFTGWMLLNYNKPVLVSSTYGAYSANQAVDENIKTYWSAATGNKGEWIESDLGKISEVRAIQVNYADQDAEFMGKQPGIYHQYRLLYSLNGRRWHMLVDQSKNKKDVPHDYLELIHPVKARYIRMENIHLPTGKFALSGLRIFGHGSIAPPHPVRDLTVLRTEKDKRNAWIKWFPQHDAYAYNLYYGTNPEKLYSSVFISSANEYWMKSMDRTKPYFFRIEAINEGGRSMKSNVVRAD